jgi:hypothetical protein
MITIDGYSKDPGHLPCGIAVTIGKSMIEEKGGLLAVMREFLGAMNDPDSWWMHWVQKKPKQDEYITYVYVIILGRVYCRGNYGGFETYPPPHIIISGPIIKGPKDMRRSGFRDFRYTTKLF